MKLAAYATMIICLGLAFGWFCDNPGVTFLTIGLGAFPLTIFKPR